MLPASYTSGKPSNPHWHPTCWGSSQWSHTVSSTPCHGAWTPAPLSAHLSIECKCTASQIAAPICTRCTTTYLATTNEVRCTGRIADGMGSRWITLLDSVLSSPTPAPTLLEWPFQEQCGSGLTASAPLSEISTPCFFSAFALYKYQLFQLYQTSTVSTLCKLFRLRLF